MELCSYDADTLAYIRQSAMFLGETAAVVQRGAEAMAALAEAAGQEPGWVPTWQQYCQEEWDRQTHRHPLCQRHDRLCWYTVWTIWCNRFRIGWLEATYAEGNTWREEGEAA